MGTNILEVKLGEWRLLCRELIHASNFSSSLLAEDVLVVSPPSYREKSESTVYDFMFLAIVHGVEVAGLEVQIRIMRELLQGSLPLVHRVVFALGNVPAYLQGLRFIEKDLNRSFGSVVSDGAVKGEVERAKELSKYIRSSSVLIDLHQTRLQVANPFFIFPLDWKSLSFVAQLEMNLPVVTHWEGSFSKDGLCSDEFAHQNNRIGFTVELGQNGFDEFCIQAGVKVLKRALTLIFSPKDDVQEKISLKKLKIYTWHSIVLNDHPSKRLVEGLYNFKLLEPGQILVPKYGNQKELRAPDEPGVAVLFPQYPNQENKIQASELVRLIREKPVDEIPGFSNI